MPTKPQARCITCRKLFAGVGRCPTCDTRKASRYDSAYRRERADMLKHRPLCEMRLEGCTMWADTAQHIDGAGRSRRIIPACAHCNGVDGAARAR